MKNTISYKKQSFILGVIAFISLSAFTVRVCNDGGINGTEEAPVIEYIEINQPLTRETGHIELYGQFGEKQGTVFLNGKELTVELWAKDKISATAPFGKSGIIMVKSSTGEQSNTITLTQWSGQLKIIKDGKGTQEATITLNIKFRGGASPSGSTPIETHFTPLSTGALSAAGEWEFGQTSWYGSYNLQYGLGKTSNLASDKFIGSVNFYPSKGEVEICPNVHGHYNRKSNITKDVKEQYIIWPGTKCVTASISENYVIQKDSAEGRETITYSYRIEWTNLTPVNPPNQ